MSDPNPPEAAENALLLVLCYAGPLALIPLRLGAGDPAVRWHSRHGLLLSAVGIAGWLLLGFVGAALTMVTGGLFAPIALLLGISAGLFLVVLHVLFALRAVDGERLRIGRISELADRLAAR